MIRTDAGIKLCRWTVKKEDATFFRMLLNRIFESGSVGTVSEFDGDPTLEFVAWATDSEILGVTRIFEDAGFSFVNAENENS